MIASTESMEPANRSPALLEILRMVDLEKSFGAVKALAGVSISLSAGEIVGLIGANGAGKSTLMAVLAGTTMPDEGHIYLGGESARFGNPRAALAAGIALVPQELHLVESLSVAENVTLGHMPQRRGVLSQRLMQSVTREILVRLGGAEHISPSAKAGDLSPVEQRLVTIARALSWKPRILILDEPSASLPTDTAQSLLPTIRTLTAEGMGVFYVSHRLGEIKELANRVVAMRNGNVVADLSGPDISIDRMVALIGGRERSPVSTRSLSFARSDPSLSARGLYGSRIQNVDIDVFPGEIVGVSGLQGSGRSELFRLLTGVQKPTHGEIDVLGRGPCRSMEEASTRGVGYLAEGRRLMALPGMDVTSNMTISALPELSRLRSFVDRKAERTAAGEMFDRLQITGQPNQDIQTLSGGNQQKIFIGRWLLRHPRLLVLDEPTMGVDVGARAEFHTLLRTLADEGIAILLTSAEPEEIALVCTRAIVLVEGRIAHEFHQPLRADQLIGASYEGHSNHPLGMALAKPEEP